jgi:predicted dithiol-disulfide oxidoreductase (DUF899 family)
MSLPDVVSREQWQEARRQLLAEEKEHTRQRDALNADRRRLPMVKIDEEYVFEGPDGPVTLAELFGGQRQLIVQHVMFGPDWEQPCPGCSAAIAEISQGVLDHLATRETSFVLASRAPYDKIAAKAKERGWYVPWYSSFGSEFNYDFQVTLDASRGLVDYNYRPVPDELSDERSTELPGYSCFLREGEDIFHTYSAFARGTEYIGNAYTLLDLTALGRQENWEEPKGRVETTRGGDPTFTS